MDEKDLRILVQRLSRSPTIDPVNNFVLYLKGQEDHIQALEKTVFALCEKVAKLQQKSEADTM